MQSHVSFDRDKTIVLRISFESSEPLTSFESFSAACTGTMRAKWERKY